MVVEWDDLECVSSSRQGNIWTDEEGVANTGGAVIIGEICNFCAYAFVEAILVTPLGALVCSPSYLICVTVY